MMYKILFVLGLSLIPCVGSAQVADCQSTLMYIDSYCSQTKCTSSEQILDSLNTIYFDVNTADPACQAAVYRSINQYVETSYASQLKSSGEALSKEKKKKKTQGWILGGVATGLAGLNVYQKVKYDKNKKAMAVSKPTVTPPTPTGGTVDCSEWEKKFNDMKAERDALQTENARLLSSGGASDAALTQKLADANKEITTLKAQITKLEEDLTNAQSTGDQSAALAAKDHELVTINEQYTLLKEAYLDMETSFKEEEQKVLLSEKQIDQLKLKNQNNNNLIQSLQLKLNKCQSLLPQT